MLSSAPLNVRSFGGLFFCAGDLWLPAPGASRGGMALAMLIAQPKGIEAEKFADDIGPDLEGDSAQANLRRQISRARKFLESVVPGIEVIQHTGSYYRINHDVTLDLDRDRFHACFLERTPAASLSAIELYKGPYLAGYHGHWVLWERAEADWEHASMLELLALDAWQRRDYENALAYAFRLTKRDCGDQVAATILMETFATMGQISIALDTYDTLARCLANRQAAPTSALRTFRDTLAAGTWNPSENLMVVRDQLQGNHPISVRAQPKGTKPMFPKQPQRLRRRS